MPSSETYYRRGEEHPHRKLSDSIVCYIRRSGLGLNELSARFGVNRSSIARARAGTTWSHLPRNGGDGGNEEF
jgi:hypothetical protein